MAVWSKIMPKMKTNKAAARRFKITGTGKILRTQSGTRHINEWMSANVKRKLRGYTELSKDQKKNVEELFPYKKYVR
jgi:large subunit ribosomal protein L35